LLRYNNSPEFAAPFYNPFTLQYDTWTDTINVWEVVDADILVLDTGFLPNGDPKRSSLDLQVNTSGLALRIIIADALIRHVPH